MMQVTHEGHSWQIAGRVEEIIARAVAEAERINGLRAGRVEFHFGVGRGVSVWLMDRRCEVGGNGAEGASG
jgi:hypothetical protein